MRRETLVSINKLREQAITDAKNRLGELIAAEGRAQVEAVQADRRLLTEAEVAADVAAGDEVVEAYARWLPTGLAEANAARVAWESATTEVSHARATLDAARAAAEMAAEALATFDKAARDARMRKEQNEMDERAQRPRTTF